MKCYRHKDREAVARLDGVRPACRDCTTQYEADKLNTGAGVMICHQGDPKWLLIPYHQNVDSN